MIKYFFFFFYLVKLNQIIISFFLLFVYSFGFAHSMMPHEHGFYAEHQPESISESFKNHNHQHHVCETPSESCINHEDHCDEGFLDLIVCIFNDLNSNHTDCDIEIETNTDKRIKFNSSGSQTKYSKSDFNVFIGHQVYFNSTVQYNYFQLFSDYSSPPIENSPHRGPPTLS